MPTNVKIALLIFLCLAVMFCCVHNTKKQFYPTMVYLSKSGAAIAACYAEALVLALILSTILRKIFFGELRSIETEQLTERSWYALTETCLAFTIFKEETVPIFVFLFALLIFMKTFHWLTNERVDLIERSVSLSNLFHLRLISVFFILGAIDASFITHSYQHVMSRGSSIQVVFGFEYCILLTMLLDNVVKYFLYIHGLFELSTSENRTVALMYVSVVMNTIKVLLYCAFFVLMVEIFTFPLFVIRPMYFALKAFKKSVTNVLKARRAMKYLNDFYPNVVPSDLRIDDNSCIICREELTLAAKKLPCSHIFHTSCLRAWFQRQQSCPTCRFGILEVPRNVQIERMRESRTTHVATQTDIDDRFYSTNYRFNLEQIRILTRAEDRIHMTAFSNEQLVEAEKGARDLLISRIETLSDLSTILESVSSIVAQLPKNDFRENESKKSSEEKKSSRTLGINRFQGVGRTSSNDQDTNDN